MKEKICGNCKHYIRCEGFINEDDDLAEWCTLFIPKKDNKK